MLFRSLANSVEQAQTMRKHDANGKPQKLAKRDDKTDVALNEQCIWEGIGIIQFPDGSTYHGMTKNGQFNGKGRMTHANGDAAVSKTRRLASMIARTSGINA